MSNALRPHAGRTRRPAGCRERLQKLFTYIDDDLRGAARERLERHLAECVCCGDLEKSLRRTIHACRTAGKRKLPADVRKRAKARITELLDGMNDERAGRREGPPSRVRRSRGASGAGATRGVPPS